MTVTLYVVRGGPPSLAVMMALKEMNLNYNQVDVNYELGEHKTEAYAKKNPQKEIPVLDDNGFYLSESNAILQYLIDKHGKDDTLYPRDLVTRAIVNNRLCFNLSTYYRHISAYVFSPFFPNYQKDPLGLEKTQTALNVFNTYLERLGKKYAAADHITIADLQLISSTMCLETINFDLTPYPLVKNWYSTFQQEHPNLWSMTKEAKDMIIEYLSKVESHDSSASSNH